jgi:hypothetical protein
MERHFLVFGPKHELDAFEQVASGTGITVKRQDIYQLSAGVKNVTEVLQIVFSKEGVALFLGLASIIKAYLAAKSSRRITITKIQDDKVVALDACGYTKEQLATLLPTCRELIVYDEKSKEHFALPTERLASDADFDERDTISFEQIQRETKEFEAILKRFKIEIKAGSPLEHMCFSLLELVQRKSTTEDTMQDLRVEYRPAFGLHDLIRRIVRLHDRPDFPVLVDHLRLLNTGTVAQNVVAPTDQVAAKIFELFIGLVCLEIGAGTQLDGPVLSYGDNPDILTRLDGRLWGFACKVLSGRSPKTMFDRLREGIDQIENSPAEIGCVIINLKNQIDHDKTWPLLNAEEYAAGTDTPTYGSWTDKSKAFDVIGEHARRCHKDFIEANGGDNVRNLLIGKKSIPGAVLFLQTVAAIQFVEGPVNSVLRYFYVMNEEVSRADREVLDRLNDAMHHHAS